MNSTIQTLTVLAASLSLAVPTHSVATEFPETRHNGIRISAGVQARTWEADFETTRLDAPPGSGMSARDTGFRGLYPGEGDITYIDGSILDAQGKLPDGMAHFTVETQEQIGPAPHVMAEEGFFNTITYSSEHVERPTTRFDPTDNSGSEDESVLAPYVMLECPLVQRDDGFAVFSALRYAYGRGTIDRGERPFGQVTHQQSVVNNQYVYDAVRFGGPIEAPFDSREDPAMSSIVTDAATVQGENLFAPPYNEPSMQSTRSINRQTFTGLSSHEIDMDLHEILLGGSLEWPVTDRLTAGILAGFTLSYVDWTFTTDTRFVNNSGQTVSRNEYERGDSEWVWGATGQLHARLDLAEDSRYFVQVDGGYNWVDDFEVDNDVSSATVELDSWVVSGAVGMRL